MSPVPAVYGAFPGGAHRTAAATRVSLSAKPSAESTLIGRVGQAGPVQRGVQHVAGAVTGEHPSGAVAAVRGGRQAQDHHPGPRRAPSGYRPAPVGSSANDLRLAMATCSRHWTSRGQARHTDTRASRSSTVCTAAPSRPPGQAWMRPRCRRRRDRGASLRRVAPASRTSHRCADGRASRIHCARAKIVANRDPAARFSRDNP